MSQVMRDAFEINQPAWTVGVTKCRLAMKS